MTLVTNTLGSGTISSSELNTNFSDLSTAIDSITSANISSTAGITAGQLADRFALSPWHFNLLPVTSGSNLGSLASYACHTGDVSVLKATTRVKAGKSAAICLIEVYVTAVSQDGGSTWPLLTVKKGTTTLGGAGLSLEAAGFHYLYYTNPIDTPLIGVQDNETIEFSLSGQTGTPTLHGLSATLWVKEELTS
tara:strand:- start:115 stop:693 length:579 start_codon:yes stop_codon:yes gene_type:complete